MQKEIYSLQEMVGNLGIYFNWSANVLLPIYPGSADVYLEENRTTIVNVSQELLKLVNFIPTRIYRGILLKEMINFLMPHKRLQYLSFSVDRSVAEHFANINGFGSGITDVAASLGKYGYVIDYFPKISEVLFHYQFLSILPYKEAFTQYGMNGRTEVES